MELVLFVVFVGGVVTLFVHPKTKNSAFVKALKKWWKGLFKTYDEMPVPEAKVVKTKSCEPGNVPRIKSETDKEPPTHNIHAFPKARDPQTRFEEFNAKLFVFKVDETRRWDKTLDNDFVTQITGERAWLSEEIKKRLRPKYPVLFDPFGLWSAASRALELDPHHDDPTVRAYLALERDVRPVVISCVSDAGTIAKGDSKDTVSVFKLYRYGFVDYDFDRKFLEDYPADLVKGLLEAFSGDEEGWESFSPARLRKAVLEENREEEISKRVMTAHQHDNRFAALWKLRDPEPVEEGDEADVEQVVL